MELQPDLGTSEISKRLLKELKAKGATASQPGSSAESIPATENALVLRTDFSNEAAWKSICAVIQNPEAEFPANIEFVSDAKFMGVTATELTARLAEGYPFSFAFIVDHAALTGPDYAILVVDLQEEPGRTFRVMASALWSVENNLSIGNMGFEEFADAVDEQGIFRGF